MGFRVDSGNAKSDELGDMEAIIVGSEVGVVGQSNVGRVEVTSISDKSKDRI